MKTTEELTVPIIYTPDEKVFYQGLSSKSSDISAGVFRHFLGLTPGHTYRLFIRVNTLDAAVSGPQPQEPANTSWKYSVHATPNKNPSIDGLTPEQFSGKAALPDGSEGIHAGELAAFTPDKTTNGEWVKVQTGLEGGLPDITVPDGFDSITVWLRLTGLCPNGVGMDWIRLEDLTLAADKAQ